MMRNSIVFFDDLCVLCSASVRLIYRYDRRGKFLFASTGSDYFSNLVKDLHLEKEELPDSLILYHNNRLFKRSSAALLIAAFMRFPWPVISLFLVIPRFLRNSLYDLVARNRYRWFGKRDDCFLPDEELSKRFLD